MSPDDAASRLRILLERSGLDEARPAQAEFAAEAAYAFQPREREGEPRMMLAEAGTGEEAHRVLPGLRGLGDRRCVGCIADHDLKARVLC